MMVTDFTELVGQLRGQEFIDTVRRIAADGVAHGGHMACGAEGCPNPAVWIGMQRCGAPGAPVCQDHWESQQVWMAFAVGHGKPWCRHCKQDVTAEHIYVVPINEVRP